MTSKNRAPSNQCNVFCKTCQKRTDTKFEDYGIGSYEYCGYRGIDTRMVEVTKCCENEEWWETEDDMIEDRQGVIYNSLADDSISLKAIEAIEKILEEEKKDGEIQKE